MILKFVILFLSLFLFQVLPKPSLGNDDEKEETAIEEPETFAISMLSDKRLFSKSATKRYIYPDIKTASCSLEIKFIEGTDNPSFAFIVSLYSIAISDKGPDNRFAIFALPKAFTDKTIKHDETVKTDFCYEDPFEYALGPEGKDRYNGEFSFKITRDEEGDIRIGGNILIAQNCLADCKQIPVNHFDKTDPPLADICRKYELIFKDLILLR